MSTDIRVALVFEQDAGTQALRTALGNAGVTIALECRASALHSSAILDTAVDAIVVNLDAELEELLDEVTEALDLATQPVIYNDPAASSDLSGWDRARWMRHLSAKLKGQSNVTPPPPPGAQAIPMPVKPVQPPASRAAATTAVAASAGVESVAAGAPAVSAPDTGADLGFSDLELMFDVPLSLQDGAVATAARAELIPEQPVAAAADEMFDLGLADLDLMLEAPASPVESRDAASASTPGETGAIESADSPADASADFGMADLDSMFDEPLEAAPAEAVPQQSQSFILGEDLGDLDALFGDAPVADEGEPGTPAPAAMADTIEFEIDSLFVESDDFEPPRPDSLVTPAELTDLDALFREFESSQTGTDAPAPPASASTANAAASTEPSAGPAKRHEPRSAPPEWSLEPVEEELPAAAMDDRLVTEWRLDSPGKTLAQAKPKAATPPAQAKTTAAPAIPAELDASLALADLKLLDDTALPAASPLSSASADLDAFDLSSLELEAMEPVAPASFAADPGDGLSLADLDFDFLPDHTDTAADSASGRGQSDGGLGDLESLFEPAIETPSSGISLPDLSRMFVLGASIGGPEAIKAFLARLPNSVPAAFVVAQHMGSEFLEMMAVQLDAASSLAVRCPKAGERLRHGEVVIAPANEQLSIDDSGHLQLNAASSGSPYNPSIDHLVRAAADRFGDQATLILFSGMGSDAVEGGRYLTSRGGQVWAQDRASCVIASMIDSAKSQGLVRFEGTPVQLAERVLQVLS